MNRRTTTALALLAMTAASSCASTPATSSAPSDEGLSGPEGFPVMIATWPMGQRAIERGIETLKAGGSLLDAVEESIKKLEAESADGSVGVRGGPNAAGYTQVDACIMNGPDHAAGSVAGVEGIVHPISAARLVMERTKHVMLVGEGARWFALEHGLESIDVAENAALKTRWLERDTSQTDGTSGHDTITVLVVGANGDVAGGCSTSGTRGKLPGRVGDSPILGSGLYVDNEVGAAGATGVGENIMRYCASFMIVELMRQGYHPQAACEEVVHRMAAVDPLGYALNACFIAVDKQGRTGAIGSSQEFPYAVATFEGSRMEKVPQIVPRR